jgi:hypothetical protein
MNDDMQGSEREDERLRRLLDAAAELPREAEPPRDAWNSIRARIDAQRVQAIAPGTGTGAPRRATRWWRLAAAATIVVAIGLSVMSQRRGKATMLPNGDSTSVVAVPPTVPPQPDTKLDSQPVTARRPIALTTVPTSLAASNPSLATAIDQYQQAARELEAAVIPRTANLPPATRDVVRRSLATIDSAIADLRTALGSDPRNAAVGQYLSAAYEQKLDFLKRVRSMPGAGM